MARLRLFAQAREAAGTSSAEVPGSTVGEVLERACEQWGEEFTALLNRCAVWVNGEPADRSAAVAPTDEVAVLPPVSGG